MSTRNDDDFNFDDDLFGTEPTPAIDDDLNFDDDPLTDVGGLNDEEFNFEDDTDGGRTNRTFVVLAIIIILLFIAGVAGIVLFALNRGPTAIDMTSTQIAVINSTQQAFLAATQTQSQDNVRSTATANVVAATGTAVANEQATSEARIEQTQASVDATQTALAAPTLTPSPTLSPTSDLTAEAAALLTNLPPLQAATALAATQTQAALDIAATQTQASADIAATQTQSAANIAATESALNASGLETQAAATQAAEETNAALPPTATGQITPGGISPDDVRLTATALSQTLSPSTPSGVVEAGTPGIGGTQVVVLVPTRLPETGLFDNIGGGNSFGVLALVALGLVGVIFGARRLRK
jgi:multidrug efflux pump subunit AcrA (membrane-fusion protein)